MWKIKTVKIDGFWGDKTVSLDFNEHINFLIGVNGSGKTTIINLIAASLNVDFVTLDKTEFQKIKIEFFELQKSNTLNPKIYIEVEKKVRPFSPYSNIIFRIKLPHELKPKEFTLNEIEEENIFRFRTEMLNRRYHKLSGQLEYDINNTLKDYVNLTWLSIHRSSGSMKNSEDKNFESSIDQKIKELSVDLRGYFGILDRQYSLETERFQKNIFLSLIEEQEEEHFFKIDDLDSEKEQESLREIFLLFGITESDFSVKLKKYFNSFNLAKAGLNSKNGIDLNQLPFILGTRRIHAIVQEWKSLVEKKNKINNPKITFIHEINNLFQRKEIFINERNEILVRTQSGKEFFLVNLSSGEKQLLIILGQSLLQENSNHIYIADEPELSLHVEWQEKLVSSLKNVNSNSQIIFATHSPDIVGSFSNSIIKVEEAIK
jgi:predicted ATPase